MLIFIMDTTQTGINKLLLNASLHQTKDT